MATEVQARPIAKPPSRLLTLVAALNAEAPLETRLDTLEELARWVVEVPTHRLLRPAPIQLKRVQQLVDVLKTHPELRQKLSTTLGSILRDTSAVHLFSEAGLPSDRGFGNETIDRISRRILPRPPDDENLERFVSRVFRRS